MPAGDRTGPEGNGPLTGRGLGDCSDSRLPGVAGRIQPFWNYGRRLFRQRNSLRRGLRSTRRGFRRGPFR